LRIGEARFFPFKSIYLKQEHFSYNNESMEQRNLLRKKIGQWGEELASRFYENKGYTILARNVYTSYGEIDLIARKSYEVVFVEVKTRTTMTFGFPEESISPVKMKHMVQSAEDYLQNHPELDDSWRIDVLSIQKLKGSGEIQYTWFENASS
jgi:putative endonuclease